MIRIVRTQTPVLVNGTKDVVGFEGSTKIYLFKWLIKETTVEFTSWKAV